MTASISKLFYCISIIASFVLIVGCNDNNGNQTSNAEDSLTSDTITIEPVNSKTYDANRYFDLAERAAFYGFYADDNGVDTLDLNLASTYYKEAIDSFEYSTGVLLSQAFKVALELNDTLWAKKIAIDLAKGGVPLTYFNREIVERDRHNWSWFYSNFNNYRQTFKQHYDLELRKELNSIFKRDSLFTLKLIAWGNPSGEWVAKHSGELPFDSDTLNYSESSIVSEGEEIYLDFIELIKGHGFPLERTIGYKTVDGGIWIYNYYHLFKSFLQRGFNINEEMMDRALCEGAINRDTHRRILKDMFEMNIMSPSEYARYLIQQRTEHMQSVKTLN